MFPAEPWSWHGPKAKVIGPAWGGCLKIVHVYRVLMRSIGGEVTVDVTQERVEVTY